MRLLFFGTPEFAVPALDALVERHDIAIVVAQPDRPAGRGLRMHAPAVATRAMALGLPLIQPSKIRSEEFLASVAAVQADIGIVIAYGRILPGALLAIPRHGFLNVHGSILPKYRGAAPIQRAIEAGERITGVSIMRVDEQLDHGPVLAIDKLEIGPDERTPALAPRLASLGASALLRVLDDIDLGTAREAPQDHNQATLAPKIEKEEGRVDWALPAQRIYDRFRAFDPWPGLFVELKGEAIKLPEIELCDALGTPGAILSIDNTGVVVAAGAGAIRIKALQRPGKTKQAAAGVARALGWSAGAALP
ncbi:MAG TPA: methionyl-tRNA formyltransferase [Thermoanaerobaculia bacterium]|nr:methionyl-tRNA formyltransferase [Thermoanaerobaculia bacterium]